MSCTIHGQSHQAIKYIAEKTAALEVLWIYASRVNHDNVAWPGIRGLAKDIGRAPGTVQKARQHLVSLQALEIAEDYVRPEWRILTPAERAKKVNLDHSEYYRPTGKIVVNGETIPVFYVPQRDTSKLDTDVPQNDTPKAATDVSNGRTSVSVEHRQNDTERITSSELDSRSTELDSKKPEPQEPKTADGGGEDRPNIYSIWESEKGLLTDSIGEKLKNAVEEYSEQWVIDAIHKSSENGKYNTLSYVLGILKRWKTNGRDVPKASVPPADITHSDQDPVKPSEYIVPMAKGDYKWTGLKKTGTDG